MKSVASTSCSSVDIDDCIFHRPTWTAALFQLLVSIIDDNNFTFWKIQHIEVNILRLDSNIESKSLNNTNLNIIKIFNKL